MADSNETDYRHPRRDLRADGNSGILGRVVGWIKNPFPKKKKQKKKRQYYCYNKFSKESIIFLSFAVLQGERDI